MQGYGAILPHHVIAEVDENQPNELGDVQDLHITETREGSADAGKEGANGNEDIAEETGAPILCEILNRRVNGAAKKKHEGVKVEERRKSPDPLPCEHSSGESLIVAVRNFNRREQDAYSSNENDRRAHHGRDIGKSSRHQEIDGSLGQRISAQQGADNVPDLGVPF